MWLWDKDIQKRTSETDVLSLFSDKKKPHPNLDGVLIWRSRRDLNPRYPFGVHTISSRARYDHFDTAPYLVAVPDSFDIIHRFFQFVKHNFRLFQIIFLLESPVQSDPVSRPNMPLPAGECKQKASPASVAQIRHWWPRVVPEGKSVGSPG